MKSLIWILFAIATPALAANETRTREQCTREFTPRSGQAGKDVIWVPTLDEVVTAMLKAAYVGPKDLVFDLGSGDGKIPIAAAKRFGARAVGIEYSQGLVELANCYVRAEQLNDRVQITQGDIFQTDFSRATVVTLYLTPELNVRLRPTLLRMRPGTRVVSNTFKMGDWLPDRTMEPEIGNTYAHLWIVPAPIEGTWEIRDDLGERFRIKLAQSYQFVKDDSAAESSFRTVREGRLRGARVELTLDDGVRLEGMVADDTMELTSIVANKVRAYSARRLR